MSSRLRDTNHEHEGLSVMHRLLLAAQESVGAYTRWTDSKHRTVDNQLVSREQKMVKVENTNGFRKIGILRC